MSGHPASPLVLVVEDHLDIRTTLAELLEDNGFRVRTAANAGAALEALREVTPDVVLTDLCMPLGDGVDLTVEMRKLAPVPIIAYTGYSDRATHQLAIAAGCDAVWVKGLEMKELVSRLRAVVPA